MGLNRIDMKRQKHDRVARGGLFLVATIPLWIFWIYAYVSFHSLQSEMDRLPRFYGIHLYKKQIFGQLELFAKVVDQFESRQLRSPLTFLKEKYDKNEIDQMAHLFGLDQPFLQVRRNGLRVLHPSSPTGALAAVLQDPYDSKAFFHTLKRITDQGSKEGYFSVGASHPASQPFAARWYLAVAYAGQELLCILMIPEEQTNDSGNILHAAQEALFQEKRKKFIYVSLPFSILASVLIGCLCFRWLPAWPAGREE